MDGRLLVLLLLATAFAGCTGDGTGGEGQTDGGGDGSGDSQNPSGGDGDPNDPPALREGDEVEVAFHMTSARSLSTEPAAEGRIGLVGMGSLFGVGNIGDGEFATEAFGIPMYIPPQTVDVSLWLQTDSVAVGNPLFDLAVWVGTTRGELGFTFIGNNQMTAGDPMEFSLDMELNNDLGMVLPAGESLTMRVLANFMPEGAGQQWIVVGPEHASGMTITMQPQFVSVPNEVTSPGETFTGTMTGGTFVDCPKSEEIHRFTVDPNAVAVQIDLSGTVPQGGDDFDIDLDLYDGSTIVWHGGSPYPREEMYLTGKVLDDLRGKELGVGAGICLGPEANYEITVAQDVAPVATVSTVA